MPTQPPQSSQVRYPTSRCFFSLLTFCPTWAHDKTPAASTTAPTARPQSTIAAQSAHQGTIRRIRTHQCRHHNNIHRNAPHGTHNHRNGQKRWATSRNRGASMILAQGSAQPGRPHLQQLSRLLGSRGPNRPHRSAHERRGGSPSRSDREPTCFGPTLVLGNCSTRPVACGRYTPGPQVGEAGCWPLDIGIMLEGSRREDMPYALPGRLIFDPSPPLRFCISSSVQVSAPASSSDGRRRPCCSEPAEHTDSPCFDNAVAASK